MNVIFLLDKDIVYCLIWVLNIFFKPKLIYHTFLVVCAFINYLNPACVPETRMDCVYFKDNRAMSIKLRLYITR